MRIEPALFRNENLIPKYLLHSIGREGPYERGPGFSA
jgi:hypothetical protein